MISGIINARGHQIDLPQRLNHKEVNVSIQQKVCKVNDCDSSYSMKTGYCNRHYLQVKRFGDIRAQTRRTPRKAIKKAELALIPLGVGGKDGYAKIDVEYDWIDRYFWYSDSTGYVKGKVNGKITKMHRLITDAPEKSHVDHINHDVKDNRLINLRVTNSSKNVANSLISKNNTTGFKGVFRNGSIYYMARIVFNRKNIYLGNYKHALDAAKAYDAKAVELFGEHALTNKEMGLYE